MVKAEIRVLGIDDAPFEKERDKEVLVVGTVFRGGTVLDGLLSCKVTVDGHDATEKLATMINRSRHKPQLQLVMLKGIALGGFNVIDVKGLSRKTGLPVLVVIKQRPDFRAIRRALAHFPDGPARLALIRAAGKIEAVGKLWMQRTGITRERATRAIELTATRGLIPEPLRVAHIIASGVVLGESRGRA